VAIPYITKQGNLSGSIHIKARPPRTVFTDHPATSPASERAWILQEEMLSLRKIYYAKGSMYWACQEAKMHETNEETIMSEADWNWDEPVYNYTRKLTYQTDKLIALHGLAAAMQKCRPLDRYLAGLWQNELPGNLLWFGPFRSTQNDNQFTMPFLDLGIS
jgi:hypothetical protein